jgi:hypothetical protein
MEQTFAPGDIARRISGWTPMYVVRLLDNSGHRLLVNYCGSREEHAVAAAASLMVRVTDPAREFKKCDDWVKRMTLEQRWRLYDQCCYETHRDKPETQETTMTKLYQTKEETPRFGTMLATNSAGKFVLEMKGTGEVLTFDPASVEEVRPYTVDVRFSNSSTLYGYISVKGAVAVGDVLLVKGSADFARVVKVDSKNERATKHLRGRKVATEEIVAPVIEPLNEIEADEE